MLQKKENILQLKVQLKDFKPSIYRTFLISENSNFRDLHTYIQDAFGFYDYHLWKFYKRDAKMNNILEIIVKDDVYHEFSDFAASYQHSFEPEVTLSEIFIKIGLEKISYEYDFGDGWDFNIELQKNLTPIEESEYPQLLKSKWGKIVEDCWGVYGYKELIDNFQKKKFDEDVFESWEEFEDYMEPAFEEYTQEDFFNDRKI